jgi:hypothetical protein
MAQNPITRPESHVARVSQNCAEFYIYNVVSMMVTKKYSREIHLVISDHISLTIVRSEIAIMKMGDDDRAIRDRTG